MTGLPGYDNWLAGYDRRIEPAWCLNRECPNHTQPINVEYETEYGQGTITPEECPDCHGELTLDVPEDDDEEEEEEEDE